ncbi:phage portal protein [Actinomadura rayongensis]|uniref:Phage portal protein n=1 Tax=Actinomadura rayongensis TaxID=1429076 RepID=A0A6I4WBY9_9ACTN|nr:phage portal protein [Actinomadura rayongensis]MXQ67707.1 phage portal protein [Actinomadura rayongensis]
MPEIDARLTRGLDALRTQRGSLDRLHAWYVGDHPRPYIPRKAADEYRKIVDTASSAWLRLVIDSITERLRLDGWTAEDTDDAETDREAWRIWRANRMPHASTLVHTEALTLGQSYVSVWPNPADPATPTIRGESARRVYVARSSLDFSPLWAVKSWAAGPDEPPGETAFLYDAQRVQRYTRPDKTGEWTPDGPPVPNPLGRVPFVEFSNNRDLLGRVMSEIAPLIPIQERINATNLHMQLAMLVAAFRQRWAAGLVIPVDENGDPVEPFNSAVDRLWVSDNPEAKFGEFSESNLANYVTVLESLVRQLSAISAVPAHYLLGEMVNLSAEALKAAEAGLSAKVRHKQLSLGESWADVMELVRLAGGRVATVEPHWADTEARSEAQLVDALSKLGAPPIGVPQEALWERYGASPTLIKRWQDMQARATTRATQAEVAGAFAARQHDPLDVPDAA